MNQNRVNYQSYEHIHHTDLKVKKDLYLVELRKRRLQDDIQCYRSNKELIENSKDEKKYFEQWISKFLELIKYINLNAFYSSNDAQLTIKELFGQYIDALRSVKKNFKVELISCALERCNIGVFMYMIERRSDFSKDVLRDLSEIFKHLCNASWNYKDNLYYSKILANFSSLLTLKDRSIELNVR